jgi:iron complex outermembrane receptor protein
MQGYEKNGSGRTSVRSAVRGCLSGARVTRLIGSTGSLIIAAHTSVAVGAVADSRDEGLQEIVVTAQRRSQSVQDIPYNISVLGEDSLSESGTTSLNNLAQVVPGLTTVDQGPGTRALRNDFVMRGLRTDSPGGGQQAAIAGQTVSSVSTYFGETPVFFAMPMEDIERVEVLRGPQGTLYGSGSQGGTIRLIPNRPAFDSFSGKIEGDVSHTMNSADPGASGAMVLNIPIASALAVRLVGGYDYTSGFIDRVNLLQRGAGTRETSIPIPSIPGDQLSGPVLQGVQKDTNSGSQWYARAAVRWKPTNELDFQLDYLHEHTRSNDSQATNPFYHGGTVDLTAPNPSADPSTGVYPNSAFVARGGGKYAATGFLEEPYEDSINLVSLVGSVDVGLGTVTSSSSYAYVGTDTFEDGTGYFVFPPAGGNFNSFYPYNNYPRLLSAEPTANDVRALTQEIRFASTPGKFFDYIVGFFYQQEKDSTHAQIFNPGVMAYLDAIGQPNPSTSGDQSWDYQRRTTFEDKALFGEFTLHLTQRWAATFGLRAFRQNFENNTVSHLPLCGSFCATDFADPTGLSVNHASNNVSKHVSKVNTAYDLSDSLKLYATYSEGFRRGGANAVPTAGPFASLPDYQTFAPDLAKNYEIGVKGTIAKTLRFSADAFLIDLTNFQFNSLTFSGYPITFNGPKARSKGLELELTADITDHLTSGFGYSYTESTVSKTFDLLDYQPYALVPGLGGTGTVSSVFGESVKAGSPLPGVSKNVLTASLDYRFALPGQPAWKLTAHINGSYRSSQVGNISTASPYYWVIPSDFVGSARMTLDFDEHTSVAAYVNNFTNSLGYSGAGSITAFPNYYGKYDITRPRTVGLSGTYRF